ncbi:GNAT family N-acetyltransferase [Rickettsia endosymbiont of Ceutorhynchus obstrictus]|uniref:GNAT family N-acetyltransferase n=1 Tax=Rickettsia endosymbiont of Ceutorhynchus obstrictus TaxID=3066249 RepID=UPI003132D4B1
MSSSYKLIEVVPYTLKKAGFKALRILKANDKTEWEAAKYFRQKYFFGLHNIEDPYTWTFNHTQHAHLVLYEGVEIIGYSHIQLWSDERAAMRIIVIDELKRNNNFGSKFLQVCEKWLKSKNYKTIHVESSPQALAFYRKNHYIEMPFNDPDGYESSEHDIAMGKKL